MTANRCRWVRHRLALFAGDSGGSDLRPDDRRLVERHLLGCAPCRAERDSLTSAISVLQAASIVAPTSYNAPSIWPAVSRQIHRSRHPRRHGFFSGMGTGPAIGLAASLVGVGTVIGLIGWSLGSASATRSRAYQDSVLTIQPRPALPPDGPQLVDIPTSTKSQGLDLDPKSSLMSNARDPQKSQ